MGNLDFNIFYFINNPCLKCFNKQHKFLCNPDDESRHEDHHQALLKLSHAVEFKTHFNLFNTIHYCQVYDMSLRLRKPTICICENQDADQLCSYCTADQCLCFRHTDSTIPLLLILKVSSF